MEFPLGHHKLLFSLAKNIAELLLLLYKMVVLHLSCQGPLYVMDTYQEYEDQHKTEFKLKYFQRQKGVVLKMAKAHF
jgi:hypothetical protein